MELPAADGLPTRIFVEEAPHAGLLPEGRWVLLGDAAVRDTWRSAGLPEPPGSRWVPVSEATKRLEVLVPWLEGWAEAGLDRAATVVAVGGGVLTDMAGLAAALYMRGIPWHAWPTTLLSQVDAGLGGKTAVDLAAGKNLAGAFHHPARFVACRSFLATLPPRQLDSGRWELVKMALMAGDAAWARALLAPGMPGADSLARALRTKAEIVGRDPREAGERRLLNLGHTLGHALEAASAFRLLHGEAVGLGCLAACFLAEAEGLPPFPGDLLAAMAARLAPLRPDLPAWEACLPLLRRDKKAVGADGPGESRIHCILPRPHALADQRPLPPQVWRRPHERMARLLQSSEMPT
ncbi:3-dehydroquinate synthase [Mesoterricola sediminis]|uniref:3-dehydroquinate synthase n=1 Tax=Mesoterricola sediminis TaxID=2927980 RepID=A0AA48KCK9_9BACT|nr:3-dehydroquinate synthase family protein [Mesoterricola sediminis]BDU77254.1 3-dehydroquinate synthase [Mesoterricola sediminis]